MATSVRFVWRLLDRWRPKYRIDRRTHCYVWLGACSMKGRFSNVPYPEARLEGRVVSVVAVVHAQGTGIDVPPGYERHHTCLNTLCINPAHIQVITKNINRHLALYDRHHNGGSR